jgi:hypothetical protein
METTTMDSIALNNLNIISSIEDDLRNFNLIVDGKLLSISKDKNYDGIFTLKELEYPIFFSFNQLFNSIKLCYYHKIEGKKIGDVLVLLNNSIDSVCYILDKMKDDPDYDILEKIIDDIDDKYIILNDRYRTCSFSQLYETFNDNLDLICDSLKDCHGYLYLSKSTTEFDMPDNDGGVNKETGEENPNLQYDDDEIIPKTEFNEEQKKID